MYLCQLLQTKFSSPTNTQHRPYITKERKTMTHTTPSRTAMQLSKPNTKRLIDHTCTPSKQVLAFAITYFTILSAVWLLHPSQTEQFYFVDGYYPTPSLLASAIIRTISKDLKDSFTANALASKHGKPKTRGNTISSSSPSAKELTNGASLSQTIEIVSPLANHQTCYFHY